MSDRCRVTSKPQRRIPIVPIAGVAAAAVLALGIHGRMSPAAGAHTTYAGTGGIENTELFDVAAEASFAPSLLFPSELVPSNPDWPQVSGAQKPSRSVMGELIEATRAIEDEGYEVGYALLDLDTGATVTYNADTAFYSASSIKGPYVTSVVEYELGDAVKSDASRISAILEYSDNAAYSTLRDAYGNTPFAKLVEATGAASLPSHGATDAVDAAAQIQSGASIADNKYEFFTPNQMLALWKGCYEYLSGGSAGAEWLASEFEKPETSAIRVTAGSLGTTWSKAGWYPDEESGYGTTVDAGAVRTGDGDFLIVVMTTMPEDFTTMETIVSPLITLRASLVA